MSNADKFVHFLFSHQVVIIEGLFALILFLCILWLFANMSKAESSSAENQIKDLENVLEKVIKKNASVTITAAVGTAPSSGGGLAPSGIPGMGTSTGMPGAGMPSGMPGAAMPGMPGGMPGKSAMPGMGAAPAAGTAAIAKPTPVPLTPTGPSPEQVAELNKLKADNDAKGAKVVELEKAVAQAKEDLAKAQSSPGTPKINVDELQTKIKTLEARLSEYEIIEDDIANLSLYKDENIRLKEELQKLKTGEMLDKVATTSAKTSVREEEKPKEPEQTIVLREKSEAPVDGSIDANKLMAEVSDMATQKTAEESTETDDKDSGDKLIEEFENFVKGGVQK